MRVRFVVLLGLAIGCGGVSAGTDFAGEVTVGASGGGAGGMPVAAPGGTSAAPQGGKGGQVQAGSGDAQQEAGSGGMLATAGRPPTGGASGATMGGGGPSVVAGTGGVDVGLSGAGGETQGGSGEAGAGGGPAEPTDAEICAACGPDDLCAYNAQGKRYCLFVGAGSCDVQVPSSNPDDVKDCGRYCAAQREGCQAAYMLCGTKPLLGADGKACPICGLEPGPTRNCGPGAP